MVDLNRYSPVSKQVQQVPKKKGTRPDLQDQKPMAASLSYEEIQTLTHLKQYS